MEPPDIIPDKELEKDRRYFTCSTCGADALHFDDTRVDIVCGECNVREIHRIKRPTVFHGWWNAWLGDYTSRIEAMLYDKLGK